jgi:CheY-like chemotaxis protein
MIAASKTILVVEDQPEVLELAASFLADEGYEVVTAASGDEAVAILRERPAIDLVFTDVVMPGIDGFGVARQAIALNPGTRILYTTGYADELHRNDPLVARGDLLPKPYRLAALGGRIAELLTAPPEQLNRILRETYAHWRATRGGSGVPDEAEFLAEQIEAMLPFISFVETVDGADEFRYRSVGAAVVEDIGIDLTGTVVGGAVNDEHRRFLRDLYRETAETGRPIYAASLYATPQATVATERLFLPLAAGSGQVIAVVQTFDRIGTRASIYEVMRENPARRDLVRRIDPEAGPPAGD